MVFGGWLAIAVLSQLRTRRKAHLLGVFVTCEVAIVVLFAAVMLAHPANDTVSFTALDPLLLASPEGAGTLVGAIAGLVGFEVPLAFALLARDPNRTPRRAITLILLVVGVLYAGSAWAMTVTAGPNRIIAVAGEHPTDLFFFLAAPYLPAAVMTLAVMLFATSLFAAILAFQAVCHGEPGRGCGRAKVTVLRADPEPGSEGQNDYGQLGSWTDRGPDARNGSGLS